MPKWLKVIFWIFGMLFLAGFVLYQIYLIPQYVKEPNLSSNLQTKTISVNGKQRTFHWYAPQQVNGINTILYVLHGSTSNGVDIRKAMAYEFDKIAEEEGLIVVYPTGFDNHWNDCRGTADYRANTENIDDFTFFQALEKTLSNELNINFQNRFATGHSNGGHLAFKLALEHPEWINGIAPISANLPIEENLDCYKMGKFVPICLINGTADRVNPYEGGLVEIMGNASRGTVLSTSQTMTYWTGLGNCLQSSTKIIEDKISTDKTTVEQTTWICDSILQAIHYKIINGGHVIPHPHNRMPKILGTTNQDLNAPRAIWAFFKQLK